MDKPEDILAGALDNHVAMIKQLRGVPGAKPERLEEAKTVRHCALSLVGEPIMYPEINRLIDMMHERNISTFLVTNAQFPEQIRTLRPITQLYVSVDASNPESLKKIDRPLFTDYWDRFLASIDALAEKKQRTVFRLTLVKKFNMNELQGYADLVTRGEPSFIEIKGVTFCGDSKNNPNSMTMENVPWHTEVVNFARQLLDLVGPGYDLAAEHQHSNCVLIAQKKFLINGEWHTWIDYDKFQELVRLGKPFDALDYAAETPVWAQFGASEAGFDPSDQRHYRRPGGKQKDISGC